MQDFQLDSYLKLIGVNKQTPSLNFLNEILASHIACLSFSALAVQLEQYPSLAPDAIFSRLVLDQQGGYCYEQNSLLHDALLHLGFDVRPAMARVVFTLDDPFADRALTHRLNLVELNDQTWIADAGFSQMSPAVALCLDGSPVDGKRVIELRPGEWHYQKAKDQGWKSMFRFEKRQVSPLEIEMGHLWSSVHPTATFVNNLVASRIYPDRTVFLNNLTLQEILPDQTINTDIESVGGLGEVLSREFNIQLPDAALTVLFSKARARGH